MTYRIFLNNRPLTFKQVFNDYESARRFARSYIRRKFKWLVELDGFTRSGSNPSLDLYGVTIRKSN